MRTTASLVLLTAALSFASAAEQEPQEPKPPAAQADAKGRAPRHPLEGVYRLQSRVVDGVAHKRDNRGYLAITQRHLFLSLAAPGADAEHPLVHAGVREWKQTSDGVHTVMKLDYHSDVEGRISIQPFDTVEVRRIERQQGGLRVWQNDEDWLDFVRVE